MLDPLSAKWELIIGGTKVTEGTNHGGKLKVVDRLAYRIEANLIHTYVKYKLTFGSQYLKLALEFRHTAAYNYIRMHHPEWTR